MAYSMGSVVLQAASEGRRLALPHSWIMIHEPAKWAGWQSTSAAAQHLDRLKQMQAQIYQILAKRSGKPLRRSSATPSARTSISTRQKALEYGLIDADRRGMRTGSTRRRRYAASRAVLNSSSSRATLPATECSVGAQPSARARGLRTI